MNRFLVVFSVIKHWLSVFNRFFNTYFNRFLIKSGLVRLNAGFVKKIEHVVVKDHDEKKERQVLCPKPVLILLQSMHWEHWNWWAAICNTSRRINIHKKFCINDVERLIALKYDVISKIGLTLFDIIRNNILKRKCRSAQWKFYT